MTDPAGPGLDPAFVRDWVGAAAKAADLEAVADGFAERVLARLVKGASVYGETNYLTVPISELLAEIAEEADDLAGWSVATTARLFHELAQGNLAGEVDEIQQRLIRAAAWGLCAHREIEAARALLEPDNLTR